MEDRRGYRLVEHNRCFEPVWPYFPYRGIAFNKIKQAIKRSPDQDYVAYKLSEDWKTDVEILRDKDESELIKKCMEYQKRHGACWICIEQFTPTGERPKRKPSELYTRGRSMVLGE